MVSILWFGDGPGRQAKSLTSVLSGASIPPE
jgi:hypothetical protein